MDLKIVLLEIGLITIVFGVILLRKTKEAIEYSDTFIPSNREEMATKEFELSMYLAVGLSGVFLLIIGCGCVLASLVLSLIF